MADTVTITASADRIRKMYADNPSTRKFHGLVIGEKGSGKTSLALTCPGPVLVHSFDPGGTEVLSEAIDAGDVLVDTRFEKEDVNNPTAYMMWEKEFNQLGKEGFFNQIGTYVLDSTSTLCDAVIGQIMKKEQRLPAGMGAKTGEGQGMRIQDWGTLQRQFTNLSRSLGNLPCHTLILGHVGREQDGVSGKFINTLQLPGKSSDQFPVNLHEFYVLTAVASRTNGATERKLLTQYDGAYRATTRMGRKEKLDKYEEPDIRAILKKCGYPYEDKVKL